MKQNLMDMPPKEIRIALMRAEVTQATIARSLGVSITMVNHVIEGNSISHRVRRAIADATGIHISRIWPSTYIVYGGPRKPGRPKAA